MEKGILCGNICGNFVNASKVQIGALLNQPEVQQYIRGLTTPLSNNQINRLNKFVRSIKVGLGISYLSDAFDVMYILAGETEESSLKNIVKDSHHATLVGPPLFTQYEGFAGNGISDVISSNYNPFSDTDNFLQNDAAIGAYSRTNNVEGGSLFGARSAAAQLQIRPRYQENSSAMMLNDTTFSTVTQNDSSGLHSISRIGASKTYYHNTNSGITKSVASTALPNGNLILLAALSSDGITPSNLTTRQLAFFFVSKGITQSENDIIFNAIESYLDSNNKGVVP